jgi:hypothetical protein
MKGERHRAEPLVYEQKIKLNGIFHDKIICELKLTNQNAILFLYLSFAK